MNANPGPISTPLVPTKTYPYVIVAVNPRLFPVRVRVLISHQRKYEIVGESDVHPVLNQYYHGDTVDTMRHAVKEHILPDELREYDVYDLRVYPPGTTEFVSNNEYGVYAGPGPISTSLVPTTKDPYVIVAVNPKLFPVIVRVWISQGPLLDHGYSGRLEWESDIRPVLNQHHLVDTVDAMRHAVKDYILQDKLAQYDVYHLKVYPPGTTKNDLRVYPPGTTDFVSQNDFGVNAKPGPISTPLVPTTEDLPYVIFAVNPRLFPVSVRVLISRQPGKYDTLRRGRDVDARPVLNQHSLLYTVEEMRRAVRAYIFPEELRHYDVEELKVYPPGTTKFVSKNEYGADGGPGPISSPLVPTAEDPYMIVVTERCLVSGATQNAATASSEMKEK